MATDGMDLINGGLTSGMTEMSTSIDDLSTRLLEGLTQKDESLLDAFKRYSDGMTPAMKQMLADFQETSIHFLEFKDDVVAKLDEIINSNTSGFGAPDSNEGAAGIKPAKTSRLTLSDMNAVAQEFTIGSLLLYWQLQDIKALLANNQKDKVKAPKDSGGALTTLKTMPGLGENLKEISAGLLEFAKAAILLSIIPIKAAKESLYLFEEFIYRYTELAEESKDDLEDYEMFYEVILSFSKSIKEFAIALLVFVLVTPLLVLALPAALLMGVFFQLMGKNTEGSKDRMKDFKDFAFGMILMGVAVALFAAVIWLIAKFVAPVLLEALPTLLTIGVFLTGMTFLSKVVSAGTKDYILFAVGCILIAVAFMAFGAAIYILSNLEIDWPNLFQSLGAIALVFALGALIGVAATYALIPIAAFTACSVLLAVGFGAFALAMLAASAINYDAVDDFVNIIPAVYAIVACMMVIGPIALLGTVGAALFTAFAVVLAVGLVAFSASAGMMHAVNKILGKGEVVASTLNFVKEITTGFTKLLPAIILGTVAMLLTLPFTVSMLASMAAIFGTVEIMKKLSSKTSELDAETLETTMSTIKTVMTGALCAILGVDSLSVGNLVKGGIQIAGMVAANVLCLGLILPTLALFEGMILMVNHLQKLQENMSGMTAENIAPVFGTLEVIFNALSSYSEAFKGTSAKTLIALGSLVKDVAESIGMLTDVVIKLKDGIPEKDLLNATNAVRMICIEFFGDPENPDPTKWTLITLLTQIGNAKLKNMNSEVMECLTPVIDSIDRLVDVVVKVGDPNTFNEAVINNGILGISKVADLMDTIAEFAVYLCNPTGGKLFKKGVAPKEAISAIIQDDTIGQISQFIDSVVGLGSKLDAMPAGIETISSIMNAFGSETVNFDKHAKLFKSGVEKLAEPFSGKKGFGDDATLNKFFKFLGGFSDTTPEFTTSIDKLNELAVNANGFKVVAESFDKIANATERIAQSSGKVAGLFKDIFGAKDKSKDLANSTDAALNGGFDPNVKGMFDIMEDWNANGIPVRASMNTATGEIKPVDVGNTPNK